MDAAIYISIDGGANYTAVKAPTEMGMNIGDVDNTTTGRPASGVMVRSVVRGGNKAVRTIELKWQDVQISDVSAILNLVKGVFFHMKYKDLLTNNWREAEFYVGDRKAKIKRIRDGEPFISELSFNAIER